MISLSLIACSTEVGRTNPYDPESVDPAPGTVWGQVEAPTRGSQAGISVRLTGAEPPSPVSTDSEGIFLFGAVPKGRYNLEIRETGFQHFAVYGVEVGIAGRVDLGTLVLVPLSETDEASLIRGFATLEGESFHGGIQVRVIGRPFTTLTDPQGEFQLVVAEGTHDLELSFADYQTVNIEGLAVERASVLVIAETIELPSNPATVAGIAYRRTCAPDPADETELSADGAIASLLNTGHTGTVAPDGSFAITGVPAGVYTLSVALQGHETQRMPGIFLRGGQVLDMAEPLVLVASTGSLSGRVVRSGDTDHSGTLVQVTGTGFMSLTAADGSFRIPGVCAGEGYEISVTYNGFVTGTRGGITVEGGQTTVVSELTLERQQGGFSLNDGDDFSGAPDRVVTYRLEAAAGTTEMRINEEVGLFSSSERSEEGWEPYVKDGSLILSEGEGTKRVYAQVRGAGALSPILEDTVILDLSPPSEPLVVIENGGAYSNSDSGAVITTLTAVELPAEGVDRVSGLAWLKLYNHDLQGGGEPPSDPEDGVWESITAAPYTRTLQIPLLRPSVDEEKEIWVRFGDRAGNWSEPTSARITLDRIAPAETSVAIVGSSPGWAKSALVNVRLGAVDGNPGLTMRMANESTFIGAPWQPFLPEVTWSLTPGDGSKRVWVQYMDAAGNVSQAVFDDVELDTVSPTGIRLYIDGGVYTADRSLSLILAAQGATEMIFSRFRDFTDEAGDPMDWVPFDTAHLFNLPDEDGPHTIYAKFQDAALNETEAIWTVVTLDRQPPVLSAVSVLEGTDVSTPSVTLLSTAIADPLHAHEMLVEIVDVASGTSLPGAWGTFSPNSVLTLPSPPGEKRLDVLVRDAAGNVSAPSSTSVTFDPDPPVLHQVTIDDDAVYTSRTEVTVTVTADGAHQMRISNRGDYAGALWQPFADEFAWNLPPNDGLHTVFVGLRDRAGNITEGQAQISLDRTPPGAISVVLAGGDSYSLTGVVDLQLSAFDPASGMAEVEISNEPGFNESEVLAWPVGATSVARSDWTLLFGEGLRTVHARFRDVAGNVAEGAGSILVDTVAPTGSVVIASGATYSTTRTVGLAFTASSDVTQIAVADGADCESAAFQAYTSTLVWELPSGDGVKTVSACFKDAAGHVGSASASVLLDTTPPTGSVLIDGGARFATGPSVTLSITASPDTLTMAVSNALLDCATATYEPYTEQRSWTLLPGDGEKSVGVCFKDAAGLIGSASDTISLDATPPAGAIVLNSGSNYTRTTEVDVDLTFPNDANGYALAAGSLDCRTASWLPVVVGSTSLQTTYTLSPGDGYKTLVACFRDEAENMASAAASIVLDTQAPQGSVTINAGAPYTTQSSVNLAFFAPTDTTHLSVLDGPIDCETAAYQTWTPTLVWPLPGTDGEKTISVCFQDAAGHTASALSTIVLDTTPPSGTIAINDGSLHTTSKTVHLELLASDDTVLMALANTASLDCAGASYEPYGMTRGWTLGSGDGTKWVSVCYKDAAGLTGSATASIELDETPPIGSLVLSSGAAYTTSLSVSVELTFPSDTTGRSLGDGHLDCAGAVYTPVTVGSTGDSTAHSLPAGDGSKTVIACFRDQAGNTASAAATIVLDTTPPAGSMAIDQGAAFAAEQSVALSFQAPGDTSHMKVADGAGIDCAAVTEWSAFSANLAWILPPGDGNKSISVCFKDAAGNTAQASASIILDTSPPAGTVSIDGGAEYAISPAVTLSMSAPADTERMAVANGGTLDCATASYEAYSAQHPWALTSGDGPKTVTVCFKDAAGHTAFASDSIILDTLPPAGTIVLAGGGEYTTSLSVSVELGFPSDTIGWAKAGDLLDCRTAGYTSVVLGETTAGTTHALASGDGPKLVVACFKDAAGHTASAADSIVLDTTPPTGTIVIADGSEYSTTTAVTLTLGPSPDTSHMAVVEGASVDCTTVTWESFSTTKAWVLGGEGPRTIWACFRDTAGHTGKTSAAIVVDTTPPTGTLTINGSATHTITTSVRIGLTGSSDVASMALVNGAAIDCEAVAYQSWSPIVEDWLLGAGDGTKYVSACLKDAAGNTGTVQGSIILDTQAPSTASVIINDGDAWTTDLAVTLTLITPEAATIAVANEALDCGSAEFEPFQSPLPWTLRNEDGLRTVVVCFRDQAGWIVSRSASIGLDRLDPSGTMTIDGGARFATDTSVTLAFQAPVDTSQLKVVDGASIDCGTVTEWSAFTPTLAWILPAGDGTKTLSACFKDAAGNTASTSASIILDTTPPSGTVSIDGGSLYATGTSVELTLSAPSDTERMAIANAAALDCGSATYETFFALRPWALSAGDGLKTVSVCFKDAAGHTAFATDTITLDTSPPAGSITLAGGADYTTLSSVAVALSFPSDTAGWAIAGDILDCNTASYSAVTLGSVSANTTHQLSSGDGAKVVVACFRDAAGHVASASDSIVLDTSPPSGTVAIEGGALYTTSRDVVLSFFAPSDTGWISVTNESILESGCGAAVYQGWTPTLSWTLSLGDGSKTVSVCFKDAAGNVALSSAGIVLDTSPPAGSVVINDGDSHTTSRSVTLTLSAATDSVLMAVANGGGLDCATASYEPFALFRAWTLQSGDGTKSVSVCFKDAAGLTASATTSIELDETPPAGAIVLASGAAYTTLRTVSVGLSFPSDTIGYALGDGHLDCGGAVYTAVTLGAMTASTSHVLPEGDGSKTVIACFQDSAGNTASTAATIVLDTTPPSGSMTIDGGAAYATATSVTLSFQAPGDTSQIKVLDGAAFDCGAVTDWAAFSTTLAWILPLGEGTKSVSACFRDAAGNTASASASIILDTSPPAGTLGIDGGAAYTTSASVELTMVAPADTERMAVVNAATLDCSSAAYETFSSLRPWTLETGDGLKTVTVCFKDAAGHTAFASDTITLDTSPPAGTITLAGGADYATDPSITVALAFPTDTAGWSIAADLLDCNTASYTLVPLGAASATTTHQLSSGDGAKVLVACFKDAAGQVASAAASIILDTSPPSGTLTIDGGAQYTVSENVLLAFFAPSDTAWISVTNSSVDAGHCSIAVYQAWTPTLNWPLTIGDGAKTVSVCFKDAAGNTAFTSAGITLDTTPPAGSILINDGDSYTTSRSVNLTLSAAGDTSLMSIANAGSLNCANASYEPFAQARTWTLLSGDGTRSVSVCFKDAAGLTSSATSTIVLDETPPTGTVVLAGGAAYTTVRAVSVELAFPSDTVGYLIDDVHLDCSRTDYQTVTLGSITLTTAHTLPEGEGTKTVVACFKDAAGNTASDAATIVLDTLAPSGTMTIDGGAPYATDTSVVLSFQAPADTSHLKVVDGSSINCSDPIGWSSFSSTLAWILPAGDGTKSVSACFRDGAGHTASTSASIILDTTAPAGTVSIDAGASFATSTSVQLTMTAPSDTERMAIANAATLDCATATYEAFSSLRPWALDAGDGLKTVAVCFKDAAGNTALASDTITLDTSPPAGSITLAGGAEYTTTVGVAVALSFPGDTAGWSIAGDLLDCNAASYTAVILGATSASTSHNLSSGDGTKVVVACFKDAAGHVASAAGSIVLDTTPPTGTITIADGGAYTTTTNVTLTLTASSDTAQMGFAEGASVDCSTVVWESYSTTKAWILGGEGARKVWVCLRDRAGLTGSANASVIVDTIPPTGTLAINGTAAYTTTTDVTLGLTGSADVVAMALADGSAIDCQTATYEPYSATRSWVLPVGDGAKVVSGCLEDSAGNTGTVQGSIILDTQPPSTATVTIDGGAAWTTDLVVALTLTTPEPVTVAVANESLDCGSAVYQTFASPISWTLQDQDGLRTVVVCFKDSAGLTVSRTASIGLDRISPAGIITIDGGAAYTTATGVNLAFQASNDTLWLKVVDGSSIDCTEGIGWQAYTSTLAWVLPTGDGTKSISACFRDAADNSGSATASIILDTSPPAGSVAINGGSSHTTSAAVVLSMTAPSDTTRMAVTNGPTLDCGTAVYEGFVSSINWSLPTGDGSKWVAVCFQDAAGLTAMTSSSIVLDTTPPAGTITLAGGAAFATSSLVDVALSFPNDTVGWSIASDLLDCTTATYTAVTLGAITATTTHPLSSGDGSKVVVACFEDAAGNTASSVASIVLDTTPPTGTVSIAGGAAYTTTAAVTLALSASPDTTQMALVEANSINCDTVIWESFATTKAWILAAEGTRTIWVCLRDAAGLVGTTSSSIIVDTVAPTGSLAVNGADTHTMTASVTLDLTASEDVVSMALIDGGSIDCASATYEPWSATRSWILPTVDGTKYVSGCLKDAAGNTGTVQGSIVLDTQAPSTATVSINGDAAWTTAREVALTLTTPETVTVAVANESLDCSSAEYVEFVAVTPWTLRDQDGLRTVVVCFKDLAGWTVSRSASIGLDREAPAGTIVADGGAAFTTSRLVNLTLSAPSDTDRMAIENVATLDCGLVPEVAYGAYSPTYADWDLDPENQIAHDGLKYVTVCFKDTAGLTASATTSIYLDRVDPVGTLLLAGGATHVNTRSIAVEIRDPSADVTGLAVGEGSLDCGSATYGAFTASQTFTLSDSDSSKIIVACLQDHAGRTAQLVDQVTLDRVAPTGTLTIANGDTWTTTRVVSILVESTDAVEVAVDNETIYCIGREYVGMSGTHLIAVDGLDPWNLNDDDGLRTVKACLRDAAGNVTVIEDTIGLDQSSPTTPVVVIDGGASVTSDHLVDLSISASDNISLSEMYISRDGTFTDGVWENYASTVTNWNLTNGLCAVSATSGVQVKVRDAAGNESDIGAAYISLDCDDPVLLALQIAGGNAWTRTTGVGVRLFASDVAPGELSDLMLSEDPAFAGATWEQYPPEDIRAFVLSSQNETKTLYAKVRDASGRISETQSDTIILDTQPPVVESFEVARPESGYTSSSTIDLALTVYDNLASGTQLRALFSDAYMDCAAIPFDDYTETFPPCPVGESCTLSKLNWSTTPAFGATTIRAWACVRDAARNFISQAVTADVIYDTTTPPKVTGLVLVPGSRQILASWGAVGDVGPSGLSHYEVLYDSLSTGEQTIEVYGTSAVLSELQNRVVYHIRVRAVDRAGNIGPWSDTRRETPGFKQAVVHDDWIVSESYRQKNTRIGVYYGDGDLFVTGVEERTAIATRDFLSISRCHVATEDCRDSSRWSRTRHTSSYVITSNTVPLVVTPERVYVATIEKSDTANTYAPVVYSCPRKSNACTLVSSWTRTQLETFTADVEPFFLDLYADATRVFVAYYRVFAANDSRPTMASCPRLGACTTAGGWSTTQIPQTAINAVSGQSLSLAGDGNYTWAAFSDGNLIQTARCTMSSGCTSWTDTGYVFDNDDGATYWSPDLVRTKNYLYTTFVSGGFTRYQYLARCSGACATTGSWSRGLFLSGNTQVALRQQVRLSYGNDALHAAWWDKTQGWIRYGWCPDPDAQDCTNVANWHLLMIDPSTARATEPGVASFGQNVGLAWVDDSDRLRTSLPSVTSPILDATGPGPASMASNWSPLFHLGGYEQFYGDSAGPPWDNTTILADSSMEQTKISVSAGQDYLSSLRSFDVWNEISDETTPTLVRPFSEAGPASGTNLSSAFYTTTAFGAQLLASWMNSGDLSLNFGVCDTLSHNCSATGSWTQVQVLNHAQALYPHDILVADGRVWIAVQNSIGDAIVAWCTLSTGCSSATDFSWHRVVDASVDGYSSAAPRLAHGSSRVWVATRDADNEIRVHHCATATDCATGTNWVKGVLASSSSTAGTGARLGHSIVAGSSTVVVIQAEPTRIRIHRCYVSGTPPCSTGTNYSSGTVISQTSPDLAPKAYSIHAVMRGNQMPAFIGIWDNQTHFVECPFYNSSCTNSERWASTAIGTAVDEAAPNEHGFMTGLAHDGNSFYAAFSSLDRVYLGTCAEGCTYSDNWRVIRSIREPDMVESAVNSRNFSVAPSSGIITLGYGRMVNSSSFRPYFLYDGRMLRVE